MKTSDYSVKLKSEIPYKQKKKCNFMLLELLISYAGFRHLQLVQNHPSLEDGKAMVMLLAYLKPRQRCLAREIVLVLAFGK